MSGRRRIPVVSLATMVLAGLGAYSLLPSLAAWGLLNPVRRPVSEGPPPSCDESVAAGVGVTLKGWRCRAAGPRRRGTVLYLHGVADNRSSGRSVMERFARRGFDVAAYDSRAHGESEGEVCTYGFFEKQDLGRVIDGLPDGPVVLIGASLGAAVALQQAAEDARVSAVVAAETFADLRSVATERAPYFIPSSVIARAFEVAEARGRFVVDDVSPIRAAALITAPVLLIHGERDIATSPEHSRRVFAALRGSKRLIVVPGAGHNESLRSEVWDEVERWLDVALGQPPG